MGNQNTSIKDDPFSSQDKENEKVRFLLSFVLGTKCNDNDEGSKEMGTTTSADNWKEEEEEEGCPNCK